jgi:hypothetical protein
MRREIIDENGVMVFSVFVLSGVFVCGDGEVQSTKKANEKKAFWQGHTPKSYVQDLDNKVYHAMKKRIRENILISADVSDSLREMPMVDAIQSHMGWNTQNSTAS